MRIVFLLTIFMPFLLGAAPAKKPVAAEILESSKPEDWRTVDPGNILYMDLPSGRVIIELAPDFAPDHVANVKALAREKYWDGLAIVRAQDNYVVQWADPNHEDKQKQRKIKAAKETLPAEFDRAFDAAIPFKALADIDTYAPETGFSKGFAAARDKKAKKMWLLHCYGAVGAGRDNAADSGGGTELYAVIGQAPRHLDRNVTLIGRVLQGVELFSTLARGHEKMGFYGKTEKKVPIKAVKLAADVSEKERVNLEVLRTDTPLFEQWVAARRNRAEEWFQYQAGRIDACNLQIPTREKK